MKKWTNISTDFSFKDIVYEKCKGISKIKICRPEVHNAFRPLTVREMIAAFEDSYKDDGIGVIILTGQGNQAFCSGGDVSTRGNCGYRDFDGKCYLNVLELQKVIRYCPKPVIAMVAGYAIGGGNILQVVCDLTIAADNAIFGQAGPKVGSFDGGFGCGYLARLVGQRKAREMWFLCKQYKATEALAMGLINKVVEYDNLEKETIEWCEKILKMSPLAIRCIKSAFNAECDGMAGIQDIAGNATMLYYMSEESQEGLNAFIEHRSPDFTNNKKSE